MSKFQSVSSLTIFVSENYGGDVTSISYIGLKGEVTTVSRSRSSVWVLHEAGVRGKGLWGQ